ncbi:MAG: acyltransferase family protein [Sumerlaeia bacterium]
MESIQPPPQTIPLAPPLPAQGQPERLVSLDAFRGITIAGMVLVNNPGSWSAIYDPLAHAAWDGWTPTDLIFPFFLFMVGVAMTYSFDKRLASGFSRLRLFEGVVRRTLMLFFLGMILGSFPNLRLITPYIMLIAGLSFLFANEPPFGKPETPSAVRNKVIGGVLLVVSLGWMLLDVGYFTTAFPKDYIWFMAEKYIRIPGVLQRIAVCYFVASVIVFFAQGWKSRTAWFVGLVVLYWVIMAYVVPPGSYVPHSGLEAPEGAPYRGELIDYVDQLILGAHLYVSRPDPEGLLSTLPAISSVLGGVLCGMWLKSARSQESKTNGMFAIGLILVFIGFCMDPFFPINKKIWSSSYVVFCTGMGTVCLALCYWFIDVKGYKAWASPFVVFGTNAILIFFGSGIMMRTFYLFRWKRIDSQEIDFGSLAFSNMNKQPGGFANLKDVIYETLIRNPFRAFAEKATWFNADHNASLVFAVSFILLWLLIALPLYRKKIFLKV